MRNFVDMHTHSNASDGQLRPAEVAQLADRKRLAVVALTDHDSVAGLAEAVEAARELPVQLIPGIEVSARFKGGTLHILGLGISPNVSKLKSVMRRLVDARHERNPRMIARLQAAGVDVSMAEWEAAAGVSGMVGRLHLAKLLCAKGYAKNIGDAFGRYIGADTPGFVDKEQLTSAEVIEAIHAAKGAAILAHPPELNFTNFAQLDRFVRSLVAEGLDGLECIHSECSPAQTRHYLDLAKRMGLLVSGGSDFHGPANLSVRMGTPRVPVAVVEQLLARLVG